MTTTYSRLSSTSKPGMTNQSVLGHQFHPEGVTLDVESRSESKWLSIMTVPVSLIPPPSSAWTTILGTDFQLEQKDPFPLVQVLLEDMKLEEIFIQRTTPLPSARGTCTPPTAESARPWRHPRTVTNRQIMLYRPSLPLRLLHRHPNLHLALLPFLVHLLFDAPSDLARKPILDLLIPSKLPPTYQGRAPHLIYPTPVHKAPNCRLRQPLFSNNCAAQITVAKHRRHQRLMSVVHPPSGIMKGELCGYKNKMPEQCEI